MLLRNSLIFLVVSSLSSLAFGQGEKDQLKPDEIQTTGIEANPANDSGMFLGAGPQFGQARTTEDGASPGTAVFLNADVGYQTRRGSFGRLEFAGQLLSGAATFRPKDGDSESKVAVGFGLLFKGGIGYSLGQKLFGVARLGLGPVLAKVEAHPEGGGKFTSDTVTGLAGYLGYGIVAPMTDSLDFTAGFSWTHYQLSVDKLKDSDGDSYDFDRTVILNVPALDLGIRFRI